MNIYVGNLSFDMTEETLRQEFEAFGEVSSSSIIKDKFTGRSRGFGFVEMPSAEQAQAAIAALNNKNVLGRNLTVNEARPRTEGGGGRGGDRPRRGPGGGDGRGGFGGGRGDRDGNRW